MEGTPAISNTLTFPACQFNFLLLIDVFRSCEFSIIGNLFAIADVMILVITRMKISAAKRLELSQTIASLIGSMRTEPGCRRFDFCQNVENENELYLLEEWENQENLKDHLRSERFRVLRGAMNLLQEPYKMQFHTLFLPSGKEGLKELMNPPLKD
jgi:quinol monooxygenase YgiN